jgi:rhodanese-related sulfurtransferase/DNA-binding transcriptional ArsR family regulator
MTGREFKDIVFEQFARIASAFASAKRLEMIDVLAQGERDVESLAKQVGMTIANTSRHLQIMKGVRLVETRRKGVQIFYRLADEKVYRCWKELQELAESRVAEIREVVRAFYQEQDALETLTREQLWQRMQEQSVTVIDVRPQEEYRQGHLPGALVISLSELKDKLKELPRDREVVAYCRGPYCVLSAEAIKILKAAGIRSVRFKDSVLDWKESGMPVESSEE